MGDLISISGIGDTSLELLEAAGFKNAETLAKASAPELARELERANLILRISEHAPDQTEIDQWIVAAREMTGVTGPSAGPAVMPVNYELTPQVIAMLTTAPFAIPLPARILVENHLGVADIPAAIMLNRYSGDLDVKVELRVPASRLPHPGADTANVMRIADQNSSRLEIDTTKLRSTTNMSEPRRRTGEAKSQQSSDRVTLLCAPRPNTNKGRSPQSRWYIRGVLHSHPRSIYLGALVTLLVMLMIPLAVISSLLLLLSGESPAHFGWVPAWLLAFPASLPGFGLLYLAFGLSSSCRICGQKLFTQRTHLKNSKAHHIRGLGYVLPLCFQILIFRWFRCTHCGTPVRLKE